MTITHIGGPTALIALGGWRLLTDPTFDLPGKRYFFGWGTMSRKLTGPAITPDDLGPTDAVLLSHDHHADNLDPSGRRLLPKLGTIVTTEPGARRLGANARGLAPWSQTTLNAPGKPPIEITATPCRHGPQGSRPIVGAVIGFDLRWAGQQHGTLWMSGDTVLYKELRQATVRLKVGTAILHLGGVRFPVSGPLHYTMTAPKRLSYASSHTPHDHPNPLRRLDPLPTRSRSRSSRARHIAASGTRTMAATRRPTQPTA